MKSVFSPVSADETWEQKHAYNHSYLGGSNLIVSQEKNEIERYLLGQLESGAEEELELRLLSDPAYVEEFDIVANELTDHYVAGELDPEDRQQFESHFLKAPERRHKVTFAKSLQEYASEQPKQQHSKVTPGNLWVRSSFGNRAAMAIAAVLLIVFGVFIFSQLRPGPPVVVALALHNVNEERGTNSPKETVTLPQNATALQVTLELPGDSPRTNKYRAELVSVSGTKSFTPTTQNAQNLSVTLSASELKAGSYALRLFAIDGAGNETRVHGSYLFNVQ